MPEAMVYKVHRNAPLVNIVAAVLAEFFTGTLAAHIAMGVAIVLSLIVFGLAYLGEEKAYLLESGLGVAQVIAAVVLGVLDAGWVGSGVAAASGLLMVFAGLAAQSRYAKARNKKALGDFVPPAFG
ncbi:MAG: hypothetical protein M1357_03175 [Candidatus Marsarchaeota archaeon]|nr:hypothetical protein [Candidatus Marsarchaeota archaeon]